MWLFRKVVIHLNNVLPKHSFMKQFFLSASISLLSCLIGFSCKKEEPPHPDRHHFGEEDWPFYLAADFGCAGITSEQYFVCKLDGKEFCRNATGTDTSFAAKSLVIITDGPTLVIGGPNNAAGHCYTLGIKDKDHTPISGSYHNHDQKDESTLGLHVSYFSKYDISWGYYLDEIVQPATDLLFVKVSQVLVLILSGFW